MKPINTWTGVHHTSMDHSQDENVRRVSTVI